MRFITLLTIIIGTFWYSTGFLLENKPTWFLEARAGMPFVNSEVILDFDQNITAWTEEDVEEKYDNLLLDCEAETSDLGDRACFAVINQFNSIKADNIVFFFEDNRFRSLRVTYPPNQYNKIRDYAESLSSVHKTVPASAGNNNTELGIWIINNGIVTLTEQRPVSDLMSIFTWNSYRKFNRYKHSE